LIITGNANSGGSGRATPNRAGAGLVGLHPTANGTTLIGFDISSERGHTVPTVVTTSPRGRLMKIMRAIAVATCAILATLALSAAPARADGTPPRPFYADSTNPNFDTCPHGITRGTLTWYTPGPLPAISVTISGVVIDRPTGSSTADCTLDDYNSTATFIAYSGSVVVGSASVTVDNATKQFSVTLGRNSTTTVALSQVVIRVCRNPIHTLPPSYCGTSVTYKP
jgi:hypothetical protein